MKKHIIKISKTGRTKHDVTKINRLQTTTLPKHITKTIKNISKSSEKDFQ